MRKSIDRSVIAVMILMLLSTGILSMSSGAGSFGRPAADSPVGSDHNPQDARSISAPETQQAKTARAKEAYGKLPISFEANLGQTDPSVRFVARTSGSTLFLTSNGAVISFGTPLKKSSGAESESQSNARSAAVRMNAIRMNLVGANQSPEINGLGPLPGYINYFKGSDRRAWHSNIPTYDRVEYANLYPNVNLVYYGNESRLEYDFQVAPGGDPRDIRMAFEGVRKIRINLNGDIVLQAAASEVIMQKPSVYQETNGVRQSITGSYVLRGKRQVAFEVGSYDKTKVLVIDPVLSYSTYLGGTSSDAGRSIAVDSAGNAYVTGQTTSFNFPVTINGYDSTYANSNDVFVTKMNAQGSAMIYSTYLGGNSDDSGMSIVLDSAGNAYVTGWTYSSDYPTTPGVYQGAVIGYGSEVFITKLNSAGADLLYSTYLGGSSYEQGSAIAVDSAGNAYIAGSTSSANFPTTPGAFQTVLTPSYGTDAFITKMNNTGTALVYSTFLGGSMEDQANAIKVDSLGYAYVTGYTRSSDFDVTPGAFQTTYGGSINGYSSYFDAFVTKINTTGGSLVYSTYLGGNGDDNGLGLALADSGEAYVIGNSTSANFPTTPGVVRVGNGGMAKSATAAASWFSINSGLTGTTELSVAVDPSNPSVVFAGGYQSGVFKSTNGGTAWTAASSGLTDLTIRALTIDPLTTSTMYLGTDQRGIFRSTNGGSTWRAINTGQNGPTVRVIKIDPTNSSVIYAGTNNGIYKTTNGGASWAGSGGSFQNYNITALAIDPSAPSTLFAGLTTYYNNGTGVIRSTDGGMNWSAIVGGANISSIVIDPTITSTVYAGTDGGIIKSIDGGDNWSGVNTGLADRTVNALALSPDNSTIIYAGTHNGIFKSTNGGTSWTPGNNGLAGVVVNALAIDPATPATIYTALDSGGTDAFIAKLNAAGSGLAYSTYLGGSGNDQGYSIAIDASGNAYVTGVTESRNFPTVHGGYDAPVNYGNDAFVTKLNPAGAVLVYSTVLGGSSSDSGYGIAVDSSGSAYVTGATGSQDFPITEDAFQSVRVGYDSDSFISKIAPLPSSSADIRVTMTTPNSSYVAGSNFPYNITVTNNGPDRASSVAINDEMPASLVFNSCSSQYSYSCFHAGNSVRFVIGSLEVGASVNVSLYANVSCAIPSSTSIDNTITVDSNADDPNPSDNSTTATIGATNPGMYIFPTSQLFQREGGTGYVNVNAGQSCTWSSVSNVGWVTITNSTNCCYGYVSYTVAPNAGPPRSGTMTIAGQTFTVNQQGCQYTLDRDHQSFAGNGGAGVVNVVTSISDCAWTATTNSSFINITSGGSYIGSAAVQYSVAANASSTSRSDTITIAGQTFTVYQGFDFGDVGPNDPFYLEIGKLAARGVTLGCGNGNYCPDDPLIREQMAAFIMRAKGEFNPPTPAMQRFGDVPPSNQFYNFIDRLAELGITLGCQPGNPPLYCPADPVKREQMSAFILRGLGEFNPPTPASQRFGDVPPSNQFYNFIDRLAVLGITLGCQPGNPPLFCPNDSVTRGQMAAFLVRAFNL